MLDSIMALTGDESRELSRRLIDIYFRTVPYPYTRHHIDSFDQFLQQDLISIIKSQNPILILKDLINEKTNTYKYKVVWVEITKLKIIFKKNTYMIESKDNNGPNKDKGSSGVERFEVENYKRTAIPFSTFILTIIGVCLSSRKIRGGIGMHLALGLLLAASYELFLHVSSIFAINGMLPPIAAVWLPNVVYGFIALYLYKTAQK